MAAPQVSGAVALLMQRHPDWTVAQIKSALVQTGDPVRDDSGREVSVLREGGGLIDLVRPTIRSSSPSPTLDLVPGERRHGAGRPRRRRRRRGHAGRSPPRSSTTYPASRSVASTASRCPAGSTVTANVAHAAPNGDVTGFVVLTHDGQTRRIPFWVEVDHPAASHASPRQRSRTRHLPGDDRRRQPAASFATATRPTGDGAYPGPEVAYLVHVTKPIANFGVAVLSGHGGPARRVRAATRTTSSASPGCRPTSTRTSRSFGEARPVAGVDPARARHLRDRLRHALREPGRAVHVPLLDQRHDAAEAARRSRRRGRKIVVSITDGGAGVDPDSVRATRRRPQHPSATTATAG